MVFRLASFPRVHSSGHARVSNRYTSSHTSTRASHQGYQRHCTIQSREPTEDAVLPQGTRVCVFPPGDSTSRATLTVGACDCIVRHRCFPSVSRTCDPPWHASSATTPSCFVHPSPSVRPSTGPLCFVPRPRGFRPTSVRSSSSSIPFRQAEFHELAEWSHGVRRARAHTSSRAHVLWPHEGCTPRMERSLSKGKSLRVRTRTSPGLFGTWKGKPNVHRYLSPLDPRGEDASAPGAEGGMDHVAVPPSPVLAGKQDPRDGRARKRTNDARM